MTAEESATARAYDFESRLDSCAAALPECLLLDQVRLAKRLAGLRRRVRKSGPHATAAALTDVEAAVERSLAVVSARAEWQPRLDFPPALPFSEHAETIAALLARHQVLILSGETGSGKSTQLPKLCLRLGRGLTGRIGHTQPRRIAARAIARRLAEETATSPGGLVGHSIRFDDNIASATRVKVMTDGILLNEIHADPWLYQYDTLIIDEVHERNLNVEFILGYLKRVLARRPALKLIVTSATLDVAMFAAFFDDSVCYVIPGRSHTVEVRYRPPELAEDDRDNVDVADIDDAILAAVSELDADDYGDILVFLPGEREIRAAALRLSRAQLAATEVLTLFGRMSAARQARVFEPGPSRRIILATNVAETSLTVPRVRHVIDTGMARVSRYNPRRKLQQLPVEKIARANAEQRAGRCGRERPGICIRLYGENDFSGRRQSQEPEIQRTNLAGVILRLKALGIDDVERFPFVEPPATRLIKDGYGVLQEIGALDIERRLTASGARLLRFPTDPRLARVLLAGAELGCLSECAVIVAALSIVDPRERPHELRDAADRAHAAFEDRRSDFLWFVRAWPLAVELQSWSAKRQARHCRRHFLAVVRLREWVQLHDYLLQLARADGLALNPVPATYKAIHTALAAGFPSHLGEWQGDHYLGCRNATFLAHPASVLARHAPRWVIAAEMIETNRRYARVVARIEPSWLDRVAGHLIRRSYDAPFWDVRRGSVRATEIQRLHGLVINAARQVDFARIDAAAARALFIDSALLDGELGEEVGFLQHNLALLARIHELEARARRRDLALPRADLKAFYAARVPVDIVTRRELLAWLRNEPAADVSLRMSELDATSEQLASVHAYLFPDTFDIGGTSCTLRYRFAPGEVDDGVTLRVPLLLLPRLAQAPLDRLVPGLLSAKIEALLRALPKRYRRLCSPLREFAMACVEAVAVEPGALAEVLATALERMTGIRVPPALFADAALPPHLRFTLALVDATGQVQAQSRCLADLEAQCGAAARAAREQVEWGVVGRSSGSWTLPRIPVIVEVERAETVVHGYPALVDRGDHTEIAVFDQPMQARLAHVDGIARLLVLRVAREQREVERTLSSRPEFALLATRYGHTTSPSAALVLAAARRWSAGHDGSGHASDYRLADGPRDADAFERLVQRFATAVTVETATAGKHMQTLFQRGDAAYRELERLRVPPLSGDDLRSQIRHLLGPALIVIVDAGNTAHVALSFDAIERRLQRAAANPGKDIVKLEPLAPLWARYLASLAETAAGDERAHALLWMFEDYRVGLFAPELGANKRVTLAELDAALNTLEQVRLNTIPAAP